MDGTTCQQPGCGVCDFLPFHCELCSQDFCSAHRSRFIHDCLPSIVKPYTASESNAAGGAGSVKQMLEDVAARHSGAPAHSSKQHFNVASSAVQRQATDPRLARLDAAAENSKTSKQRNIAIRTKMMLMKNKAEGSPSIPSEDRFYLALQFAVTGETRHFFFAPTCTVGEMVEQLCRTSALPAFGVPHPPPDKTLVTETADSTWNYFDRNSKLSDCFETCETVRVSVLPIAQVTENQDMLRSLRVTQETAQESAGAEAGSSADPEPPYTPGAVYEKQERVIYLKSTEDPSRPLEFPAVVLAVHREDVELYYTVEMTVDGERREKQTDNFHLRKLPAAVSGAAAAAAEGGYAQSHNASGPSSLPELHKTSGGGFSIRVALGNRTTEIGGLSPDTLVADLESTIRQWGRVQGGNKVKIICRGKTVAPSARTLRDTNITPGCKVSVMATTGR